MNRKVLDQLARTTLLPPSMSTSILEGKEPAMDEIALALFIAAWDAEAVIAADPKSTWNERRAARLGLITSAAALVVLKQG